MIKGHDTTAVQLNAAWCEQISRLSFVHALTIYNDEQGRDLSDLLTPVTSQYTFGEVRYGYGDCFVFSPTLLGHSPQKSTYFSKSTVRSGLDFSRCKRQIYGRYFCFTDTRTCQQIPVLHVPIQEPMA